MLSTLPRADSFRVAAKKSDTFSDMPSLVRSTAVATLLVATLAACGAIGGGDTPTPTPTTPRTTPLSAEPAHGPVISNDDFSYTAPEGWEESDESRAMSLAVDVHDEDGFVDNINVVTDSTLVGLQGTELEDAAEQMLGDASATQIRAKDPIEIDGEEAAHTSAAVELSEPKYRIEQYAFSHGDSGYVVTISFSPEVPAAERDEVSESILTTWKWNS